MRAFQSSINFQSTYKRSENLGNTGLSKHNPTSTVRNSSELAVRKQKWDNRDAIEGIARATELAFPGDLDEPRSK